MNETQQQIKGIDISPWAEHKEEYLLGALRLIDKRLAVLEECLAPLKRKRDTRRPADAESTSNVQGPLVSMRREDARALAAVRDTRDGIDDGTHFALDTLDTDPMKG